MNAETKDRMMVGPRERAKLVWLALAALAAAAFLQPSVARAQSFGDPMSPTQNIGVHPDLIKQATIDQKLDDSIPLDLAFRDENGNKVELAQYFGSKPVILTLVYYGCPMLCTEVLNGLDRSLKNIPLMMGKDFNVVSVSIDPTEGPKLARLKHEMYTGMYERAGAAQGWHFLTGEQPQIKRLADSVGFHYAYDPDSKQFAHPAAIMLLTPDGRVSRYLYGVTYPEKELQAGLTAAAAGGIGEALDVLPPACYHYDPHAGKYGMLISRALQVSGVLTVVLGGVGLFILFRGEHYVPWSKT